jgi:hypothetical protein
VSKSEGKRERDRGRGERERELSNLLETGWKRNKKEGAIDRKTNH